MTPKFDQIKKYTVLGIDTEGNALHLDKHFDTLKDAKKWIDDLKFKGLEYNVGVVYAVPRNPAPKEA